MTKFTRFDGRAFWIVDFPIRVCLVLIDPLTFNWPNAFRRIQQFPNLILVDEFYFVFHSFFPLNGVRAHHHFIYCFLTIIPHLNTMMVSCEPCLTYVVQLPTRFHTPHHYGLKTKIHQSRQVELSFDSPLSQKFLLMKYIIHSEKHSALSAVVEVIPNGLFGITY